jgi:hypothetical protein
MNINPQKVETSQTVMTGARSVIPFTGGLLFVIYAFFWPVQYGAWLGSIVASFRAAAGF